MYALVMFDLPVKTKEQMQVANRFRNFLLDNGCFRYQYSIYMHALNSRDELPAFISKVTRSVPDDGHVSILSVTEKQYLGMTQFYQSAQKYPEKPSQLLLF
jgi:CRISPR-associated protein Cas2